MEEKLCENCEKRNQCTTPCKAVNAILWDQNQVYERHYNDSIVVFPPFREVHFSAVNDYEVEDFSTDDTFPWSSESTKPDKATIFVERFFKKTPRSELAERFGTTEQHIDIMFTKSKYAIEKIVKILAARKEGIKAAKLDRFTEDQKYFLLVDVFGFTGKEVAEMFKKSRPTINKKVNRMREKYTELFHAQETEESKSADTGLSVSEMVERMTL